MGIQYILAFGNVIRAGKILLGYARSEQRLLPYAERLLACVDTHPNHGESFHVKNSFILRVCKTYDKIHITEDVTTSSERHVIVTIKTHRSTDSLTTGSYARNSNDSNTCACRAMSRRMEDSSSIEDVRRFVQRCSHCLCTTSQVISQPPR